MPRTPKNQTLALDLFELLATANLKFCVLDNSMIKALRQLAMDMDTSLKKCIDEHPSTKTLQTALGRNLYKYRTLSLIISTINAFAYREKMKGESIASPYLKSESFTLEVIELEIERVQAAYPKIVNDDVDLAVEMFMEHYNLLGMFSSITQQCSQSQSLRWDMGYFYLYFLFSITPAGAVISQFMRRMEGINFCTRSANYQLPTYDAQDNESSHLIGLFLEGYMAYRYSGFYVAKAVDIVNQISANKSINLCNKFEHDDLEQREFAVAVRLMYESDQVLPHFVVNEITDKELEIAYTKMFMVIRDSYAITSDDFFDELKPSGRKWVSTIGALILHNLRVQQNFDVEEKQSIEDIKEKAVNILARYGWILTPDTIYRAYLKMKIR
ncbi:hypothetical protein M0C34_00990 [Agarivorans sp. TSD2052]|uniref:hypothetical protein n=1 Tax=Agarivorans sp. TSD2052 TaxID=2937286 RepID=UPI00200C00A7|nr:hypothetical protein [Agarivorans sp. TSD2052]UPW18883.1 hypothetical protein M0C34_00990 [Agarivorans sp. TSD2052]